MKNDITKIEEFFAELKKDEIETINIVLHSSPDPDAVGSGLGMKIIARHYGIDSTIFYDGNISHPQNKTIMNVLNISMEKVDKAVEGINVCVDCTPNNSCAVDAKLIIDHHKPVGKSDYSIVKPSYGACATIIWDIMKELKLNESTEELETYTALLLGIRTDTNDLISENMTKADFVAYQELLEISDKEALQKVMNYPFPRYLYDKRLSLHKEGNFSEIDGVFVGGIGSVSGGQRDSIAILAEEYARMESVSTALIFAIVDKKFLEVSVRSSNVSLDVSQMCKDLFGEYGGGSSFKGGARLPLLFFDDIESTDALWKITCNHMFKKVHKENFKEI